MELRRVRLTDPSVLPLLEGLTQEYHDRYGANSEMLSTEPEEFDPPSGLFVVLVDGDVTVAGGGFRRHDDAACEVKRMWTNPAYRRRGLAARVLAALEREAAGAGYRRLVLETGPRQPEAAALYARLGYTPIPVYGHYEQAVAFETHLVG